MKLVKSMLILILLISLVAIHNFFYIPLAIWLYILIKGEFEDDKQIKK